jgi:hypothetical protein
VSPAAAMTRDAFFLYMSGLMTRSLPVARAVVLRRSSQ